MVQVPSPKEENTELCPYIPQGLFNHLKSQFGRPIRPGTCSCIERSDHYLKTVYPILVGRKKEGTLTIITPKGSDEIISTTYNGKVSQENNQILRVERNEGGNLERIDAHRDTPFS